MHLLENLRQVINPNLSIFNPMASFFSDSNALPRECTHSNKQHPFAIRVVDKGIVQSSLPPDVKRSSSEKSIRKYFGKRVKSLFLVSKAPSFLTGYCCKTLKTVKISSVYSLRHNPVIHIENIHFNDTLSLVCLHDKEDPINIRRGSLVGLERCKFLKSLGLTTGLETVSLKVVRTLRNLQKLQLTVGEEQFAQNYHIILGLKSLKRLDLSIFSLRMEEISQGRRELPALSDFFIEVSELGRLDFLAMRLTNIFDKIGEESRSRFLDCLRTTNLPAFNIELIDKDTSRIDSKSLQSCLKNLDLLIVDVGNNASVLIACGAEDMCYQSMDKAHKKLKIIATSKPTDVHGLPAIEAESNPLDSDSDSGSDKYLCYPNLKGSELSSKIQILLKDCLGVPFSLSETSNIKRLKSVSLNLTSISQVDDSLFLTGFENANNLEHFQLQRDISNCRLKSDVYHYFSMISRISAMQNLTSLRLIDFSVKGSFGSILSEIFECIKNLKTLHLDFQTIGSMDDKDQRLRIPKNNKLTDLYIRLPQLKGDTITDFIKIILSLNDLEELTLPSGNQLIETEKDRLFLFEGFKFMKKLRKVSIFRSKKSGFFMSGVRNNHKSPVVNEVQSELRDLFNFNSSLEEFCIESNEPPYQIRYKRY